MFIPDSRVPSPPLGDPYVVHTKVSKGRDVPLSFVPAQKKFLSRRPFVPKQGQEQMSRDKTLCSGTSRDKMNSKFSLKMTRFPVLGHHFPVLEDPFLL